MIELELRTAIAAAGDPIEKAIKKYRLNRADILSSSIVHRSLDARPNHEPAFQYKLRFELRNEASVLRRLKQARAVTPFVYQIRERGTAPLSSRPIVVGFGPDRKPKTG